MYMARRILDAVERSALCNNAHPFKTRECQADCSALRVWRAVKTHVPELSRTSPGVNHGKVHHKPCCKSAGQTPCTR